MPIEGPHDHPLPTANQNGGHMDLDGMVGGSESEASVNRVGGSYQTPNIDNDGSHGAPHSFFLA